MPPQNVKWKFQRHQMENRTKTSEETYIISMCDGVRRFLDSLLIHTDVWRHIKNKMKKKKQKQKRKTHA